MIWPAFKMNRRGIPVLSRTALDEFALRYIREFCPDVCDAPAPVPVEAFLESYLGADLEYRYLSNDGRYLGMTVFTDCLVPVWDPEQKAADICAVSAGTVIADNSLLETEGALPRYRFTLAHEAGHFLFHKTAFRMLDGNKAGSLMICPAEAERSGSDQDSWSDFDWLEWQSDTFASCFLLPRPAVLKAAENWRLARGGWGESLGMTLSRVFNVSLQAVRIRLKDLGIPDEQTPFRSDLTDDMLILEPDDAHGTYF